MHFIGLGGANRVEVVLGAFGFMLFTLSPSTVTLILGLLNIAVGIVFRLWFNRERKPSVKRISRRWRRRRQERRKMRDIQRRLKQYEEV